MLVNERGYILFEALLSVTILSVGIVALLTASQESLRSVQLREHMYGPAQQVAEKILARYEIAALTGEALTALPESGQIDGFNYQAMRSEWLSDPALEQISVTVTWENRGKSGSLTLTTLLPDQPMIDDEKSTD